MKLTYIGWITTRRRLNYGPTSKVTAIPVPKCEIILSTIPNWERHTGASTFETAAYEAKGEAFANRQFSTAAAVRFQSVFDSVYDLVAIEDPICGFRLGGIKQSLSLAGLPVSSFRPVRPKTGPGRALAKNELAFYRPPHDGDLYGNQRLIFLNGIKRHS